jgi:hypothetical protein
VSFHSLPHQIKAKAQSIGFLPMQGGGAAELCEESRAIFRGDRRATVVNIALNVGILVLEPHGLLQPIPSILDGVPQKVPEHGLQPEAISQEQESFSRYTVKGIVEDAAGLPDLG